MHRAIIDIETVGQPIDAFPERFHPKLLGWFAPRGGESGDPGDREEAVRRFSLWGATGRVIVIALYNPDTDQGRTLAQPDERDLLTEFWNLVRAYDLQITFNGKQFDFPFLLLRSAVHGVRPTVRLDCRRGTRHPHYDIREVLTGTGTWKQGGLDFFCSLFGIPSPKSGLSGPEVADAYRAGRLEEIAAYCEADVHATARLYERIRDYF